MSSSPDTVKLPGIPLATHIAHWPTGPVRVCGRHAEGLKVLAGHLSITIYVEEPHDTTAMGCLNCLNERAKEVMDASSG
jgi:hypothetical protein